MVSRPGKPGLKLLSGEAHAGNAMGRQCAQVLVEVVQEVFTVLLGNESYCQILCTASQAAVLSD